ncbi:transposase IS4 family domain protein, partial [Vibrio parahaemolyticus EKP-008]
CQKDR